MRLTQFLKWVCLLLVTSACSQTKLNDVPVDSISTEYTSTIVVPNLEIPWAFTWLPDGSMLINEKSGEILHVKGGKTTKIKNVPEVKVRGQGGLLDIKLHPNYKENGWFYLSYASGEGSEKGAHTAIARAQLKDDALINVETLYKATPNTTKGQHFGSRISFDNKGYLYFSIGERGEREVNPQDITRDGGKIYRLKDDGTIPEDNPFVKDITAKKAIYSYGHRNPQGMITHPETGNIWVHEHGPRGGDEINIIKKGANYGWPVITYGINYSGTPITDQRAKDGMEQPLYYWVPSIAPSGMAMITSDIYPGWKGNILAGSLKFEYLEMLTLENSKVTKRTKLLNDIGRVRDVRQGPDGYIYAAIEGVGIVKVVPK